MKIQVITDISGNILATMPVIKNTGAGAPTHAGMAVRQNQLVHEFDVDDNFMKLPPEKIHHHYRVDLRAGAKLIYFGERKGKK